MKNDKDMEKLNQMDTDGVNFRHQKQKEKAKKFSYEEARKKKEAKQQFQESTRSIRQMKEKLLERKNPV